MDFNGIIPGLQTGNVDVGIAGMTITPERAKVVQFSNGYYTSGLKILVRDDEKGISKVEDLAGKVVAREDRHLFRAVYEGFRQSEGIEAVPQQRRHVL